MEERLPLKCSKCKNKNVCKYPNDYQDYELAIKRRLYDIVEILNCKSKDIFYININCKYFEEENNNDK